MHVNKHQMHELEESYYMGGKIGGGGLREQLHKAFATLTGNKSSLKVDKLVPHPVNF